MPCQPPPLRVRATALSIGPDYVDGDFHLNKSLSKMVQATLKRLRRIFRGAKKEEVEVNNASTAPTKNDVIRKGQALVDPNHDRCLHLKSAQLAKNCWMV